MPARQRLAKTVVEGACLPPGARRRYLFDSEVPGFCLIVLAGKRRVWRTYALRFTAKGKRRWLTIGEHGGPWTADPRTGKPRLLTAELAREQALRFRGAWQAGQDPRALMAEGRAALEPKVKDVPTLDEFLVRYMRDHAEVHTAYRTAKEHRGLVDRYISRWRGAARLDEIGPADVAELSARMKDTPSSANRTLSLLHHIFSLAIRWRVLPKFHENPCAEAPRFTEQKRERFLTAEELSRLGPVIARARGKYPHHVAAILTLAFCGARPMEILSLKREQLRLDQRHVMMRRKGKWRPLFLPVPAVEALRTAPVKPGNPYVFPGKNGHLYNEVGNLWRQIRKAAGLSDVRLYDLRHTLASWAAAEGQSLQVIGKLLGHSNTVTTERYAHLAEMDVRAAGDSVAGEIAAALKVTD